MGKRGPKPQPTRLRILRGNPSKRAIRKREPTPDPAMPAPPASLSGPVLAKWHEIAPRLHAMRVLTQADADALAIYCTNWVRWRESVAWADEHGSTVTIRNDKGEVRFLAIAPQVTAGFKALDYVIKLGDRFGLSPSARAGLSIQPDDQNDPLAKFLRGEA